jgi:hypothetical protein
MLNRLPILIAVLLLSACRAEFDVSRGELGPFRIAAVGVEDQGGGCPVATAAIWSGEGAFHTDPVRLIWLLDGEDLGEGWGVSVCGGGLLQLIAIAADGQERKAQVNVRLRTGGIQVQREALVLPDLQLEARRELQGESVRSSVPQGSALRVHLEGVSEADAVSWMSPPNQGHLLGLTTGSADILLEAWDLDEDGALVGREPASGMTSHLALVRDGQGGNSFLWVDGVFGGIDADYVRHQGRLIYAPGLEDSAYLSAWVEADASGWRLVNVTGAAEGGVNLADCALGAATFSLDWIANGRCPLATLKGAQILLELW